MLAAMLRSMFYMATAVLLSTKTARSGSYARRRREPPRPLGAGASVDLCHLGKLEKIISKILQIVQNLQSDCAFNSIHPIKNMGGRKFNDITCV